MVFPKCRATEAVISEAEQNSLTHSRSTSGHSVNRTSSNNSSSHYRIGSFGNGSITINASRPSLKQWPSFDPTREVGTGSSITITGSVQPAVVSLSPLEQQQQQLQQ